jgi:thiol-disulfide isomerase/thioredoxin
MSVRTWSRRRTLLVLLLASALAGFGLVPDLSTIAASNAAVDKNPLFNIPSGDAAALHAYLEKLAGTSPQGATEEEQGAFSIKALNTLVQAADRLIAAKPTEEQLTDAYNYKLQGLQALVSLEQPEARKQYEAAMNQARASKVGSVKVLGWENFISDRTQNWSALDANGRKAFHDEIFKQITADGANVLDVSIIQVTAKQLEYEDDAFVAKLLEEALPLFKKSTDKDVAATLQEANFDGVLRRLKLPGQQLEIKGDLLGGGQLDWKAYRGKVVLIDVWATWCPVCRQEMPDVLEMYRAYHDKGLEVLGVSLDESPEDAKKYVKDSHLPWDNMLQQDPKQRYFNHPLVQHYGINGIPQSILVGKDGRVITTHARGEQLRMELAKLFAQPGKQSDAPKQAAAPSSNKAG